MHAAKALFAWFEPVYDLVARHHEQPFTIGADGALCPRAYGLAKATP